MFNIHDDRSVRRFAIGLACLSLLTLCVTTWILLNVRHEQQAVDSLIEHLRGNDLEVAEELQSELTVQSELSVLLVLNVIASAIALSFVVRGYYSSQRSLRDAKELSADILASMDAGVITTDKDGTITSVNPRGEHLIGISSRRADMKIYDADRDHALLGQIVDEIQQFDHPIRDRDYQVNQGRHTQTLRAGCTKLKARSGQEMGLVIHVRDVTAKKLMEERIQRMQRYMGLGSLAAGLQHEIKNPLSALSLHIQLLCERLSSPQAPRAVLEETSNARGACDDDVAGSLDVLQAEVKRISGVLDGFRNYASIQEIGRSPVDVSLLIEKLVRLLRPDAAERSVRIVVNTPAEMVGLVEADQVRLEQVLLNLALNGIAAMPSGGMLTFDLSQDGGDLRINVTDTGTGIPTEIQDKIFDPYFTTKDGGTGMGLALCDKIIRQHDGSIDVTTGPDGTSFKVRLPMQSTRINTQD